ncbi:MAG: transglycosylase SLT domain-containing protein [Hyphomicrobiales bacterium]
MLQKSPPATGTDFDYLMRTAQRESAMKPGAKSKTSSATGLFQFIEQTWLATLKKSGHELGLGKYADAIERQPDGRHKVTDPKLRPAILALRKDPQTAALMAGAYTKAAAAKLQQAFGRTPLEGELYIAHFLGPGGAVRLINAAQTTPETSAAKLFPKAAHANRPIFYDKAGKARSVEAVYQNLVARHGPGEAVFAKAKPAPPPAVQVQPAVVSMRLASHFQDRSAGAVEGTGRPFQSLFVTPASAPAVDLPKLRDGPGPLVIIPNAQASAVQSAASERPGAIAPRKDGGPLNIIPRGPTGLLDKHAPMLSLFRTDTRQT